MSEETAARIEYYVKGSSSHVEKCQYHGHNDGLIDAEIVFHLPDGKIGYTCKDHALDYLVRDPRLVAALVLKASLTNSPAPTPR
jgi:hypothetical protein